MRFHKSLAADLSRTERLPIPQPLYLAKDDYLLTGGFSAPRHNWSRRPVL